MHDTTSRRMHAPFFDATATASRSVMLASHLQQEMVLRTPPRLKPRCCKRLQRTRRRRFSRDAQGRERGRCRAQCLASSAARSAELSGLSHCENGAAASSNGLRAEPLKKPAGAPGGNRTPQGGRTVRIGSDPPDRDGTSYYYLFSEKLTTPQETTVRDPAGRRRQTMAQKSGCTMAHTVKLCDCEQLRTSGVVLIFAQRRRHGCSARSSISRHLRGPISSIHVGLASALGVSVMPVE